MEDKMPKGQSEISRRNFLRASASGIFSAGLVGAFPSILLGQTQDKSEGKTITRTLGKSGIKVPIVGMGVGGTNSPSLIQAAYETGIRYFDTAANYQFGRNEQMLGDVISKLNVRKDVVMATKFFLPAQRRNLDEKSALEKANTLVTGSLRRLKTDYIDVLLVHDLSSADDVNMPEIINAMKQLKKAGKVRAIGVSSHGNMAEVLNAAAEVDEYDAVLIAFNFTMADDETMMSAIKNASAKGKGLIAMKTQAGGSNWPNPESRRNYSTSQINLAALKWVLNNESITTTIPAFANFDQLKEDFSVAGNLQYSQPEKDLLKDNNIKLSLGFCRQCKQCLVSCPHDTDIPSLMRTYMYAAQYSNFHLAKMARDDIPPSRGLTSCADCSQCVARCVNSVNIAEKINELKLIYA
jgi:uncharacterized protein